MNILIWVFQKLFHFFFNAFSWISALQKTVYEMFLMSCIWILPNISVNALQWISSDGGAQVKCADPAWNHTALRPTELFCCNNLVWASPVHKLKRFDAWHRCCISLPQCTRLNCLSAARTVKFLIHLRNTYSHCITPHYRFNLLARTMQQKLRTFIFDALYNEHFALQLIIKYQPRMSYVNTNPRK